MKLNISLAFCFVAFIILSESCKKDNGKENSFAQTFIIGASELRQTSAAMNPAVTFCPPGNSNILKFTDDRYEKYQMGNL